MRLIKFLFPDKVAYLAERSVLHAFYGWTQIEIHNINEKESDVIYFSGGYGGKNRATKIKKLSQRQLDKIILRTGKTLPSIPEVGKYVVIEEKNRIGYD